MQIILLVALIMRAIAFAQAPHLFPRVMMKGEGNALLWLSSPEIAVVKIGRAEWLGPEMEITPPQKLVVRLLRVSAELETTITGSLPQGPVQFYLFANTFSRNGYHAILSWLYPGKRYVVFLREDGGLRRSPELTHPCFRKMTQGIRSAAISRRPYSSEE